MSALDSSIVATALPSIHRSLRATINWAGWSITIYSLGLVIAFPISGKLSDQFGRRRVFFFGLALFTIASLACGFSTDIYMLIAFRALQAFGGGTIQPSAAGLIADHFGKDRDRAIGMFGTINATGQVAGPIFGGLLVGYWSWRWIFFINVPIGMVLLVFIMSSVPESQTTVRTKTDIRGLSLMASCILSAIFGITNLGDAHTAIDSPLFVVPELVAITLGYMFMRHSKRASDPFIPLKLLRAKGFAAVNLLNFMWGAFGFGSITLVPLYAEERYHLHALSAGTLLTARAVGMIAIGTIAAFALRRTGYRMPLMVGYLVGAFGTLIMVAAPKWGISPYAWLSAGAGIAGLGTGFNNPASRNAAMQLAPNDVAAISGLRLMFSFIGIIFSVSIATAILSRSSNPGIAQSHILLVVTGIVVFVMVPLVFRVPEHKGSW